VSTTEYQGINSTKEQHDSLRKLNVAKPEISTFMQDVSKNNTGQQNFNFFLSHEEKYLTLIVLLTLNSNVQVFFSITHGFFVTAKLNVKKMGICRIQISLENKI
jgi:hypothetical protein